MRERSHRSNMKFCLSSLFATFSMLIFLIIVHLSLARTDAVRRNRRGAGLEGESSPVLREAQCADGVYLHDKTTCCLCAAGQSLKEHCTSASPLDRKCEVCEPNTFRSSPNQQETCARCTSCSHPDAYLEVDTACTRASDTKCRCKARHYCTSLSDQGCKLCHPCRECGAKSVKVACAAAHDTVCNDISEARRHLGATLAATVFIVVVLCCVVARKRLCKKRTPTDPNANKTEGNDPDGDTTEESVLLHQRDKDPLAHLPEIAGVVGWKTMRRVAMKSGMSHVAIEDCELNCPTDSEERTQQLLRKWVERQGKDAMKNLVETLEKINHKDTRQKVFPSSITSRWQHYTQETSRWQHYTQETSRWQHYTQETSSHFGTMEPSSPKKIQFAVPPLQGQLDPQASEQIRRRRPTPATLQIYRQPEAGDQYDASGGAQTSDGAQRKHSTSAPPTTKALQSGVEPNPCQLRPMTGQLLWTNQNEPQEDNGNEAGLLLSNQERAVEASSSSGASKMLTKKTQVLDTILEI
ncbi:uncharacterized protein LOC133657061 isoform X2 [Entelurus aequoreus]|uniref:uncharacterized protein LOC133657061 isoform X2 n=1 Tax=Entelurus aequoreus TaxID=161455 RepID=UPI002B1DAA3E|nr:uncharacterized protein LOC133657061 isoform X2 [Entelurus aequoreus]